MKPCLQGNCQDALRCIITLEQRNSHNNVFVPLNTGRLLDWVPDMICIWHKRQNIHLWSTEVVKLSTQEMSGGLHLCVTMSLLCQQAGNLKYKIFLKWKLCSSSSVYQFFMRQSPFFSECGLIYKLLTNYPCIMDIGQTEHKSLGRDRKGLRIWLEKGSNYHNKSAFISLDKLFLIFLRKHTPCGCLY